VQQQLAEQRPVGDRTRQYLGYLRGVGPGGRQPGDEPAGPLLPFRLGQPQEDLLAGLEVLQQGRLVHAHLRRDAAEADRAHAVAQRQFAGRVEDRGVPLQLLLGPPRPQEAGSLRAHEVTLTHSKATPLPC
jgi:hypothetical protein